MSNKEFKNETISMIAIMLRNADKGPSGFWVEDHEGCGNPRIFPEFAEGLKKGRLVQKKHYLCPWNTAVLYGDGHGNIHNGCYYSCSFKDAQYLSAHLLKGVLSRFRKGLQSGRYDDLNHLTPLLTTDEEVYIRKRKVMEERREEQQRKTEYTDKKKRASAIMQRYQGKPDIQAMLARNYGDKIIVMTENGSVDFNPEGMADIESKQEISYDDYLDLQIRSWGKQRSWFAICYHNIPSQFMGRVEKKSKGRICFERIYVTGMYSDDCSFFDGKEDHVWMDATGFEEFEKGDCVSFYAEVYRYVKTGNGKLFDYALRNPASTEHIDAYKLPSDNEIIRQSVNQIICGTCYLSEYCDRMYCLQNSAEIEALRNQMVDMIKSSKE